MIKKIWKLLVEDPSKNVKNIEKPLTDTKFSHSTTTKVVPIKEEKKEIRKPSLGEQLSILKQQSMYSSSSIPDFQVIVLKQYY